MKPFIYMSVCHSVTYVTFFTMYILNAYEKLSYPFVVLWTRVLAFFAVSNMGRMAKLTIKWSFIAVLWTDEQALSASNRLRCCLTVFREPYLPVMLDLELEKVWKLKWQEGVVGFVLRASGS